MRSVVRWEPVSDLISLREAMNRLFEDSFVSPAGGATPSSGGGGLALDMYETEDHYVVTADLPGVKPEDVDITVSEDVLQIKGETKAEQDVERENYVYRERRYGTFSRAIRLPANAKGSDAQASFEDGVLKLEIPKAEETKPKKIEVKGG